MFLKQTAAKNSAVLARSAFSEMPNVSMWAEGWRVVEQVPAGSPCNALTSFKKLDGLDAEEMLCLARNRFPLSWRLLMAPVVEWVIFAIVPPAIPAGEARLGPRQLYRRILALQPLLVCVYSDPSAWHVGTGRMTKRPGCVRYVAAD